MLAIGARTRLGHSFAWRPWETGVQAHCSRFACVVAELTLHPVGAESQGSRVSQSPTKPCMAAGWRVGLADPQPDPCRQPTAKSFHKLAKMAKAGLPALVVGAAIFFCVLAKPVVMAHVMHGASSIAPNTCIDSSCAPPDPAPHNFPMPGLFSIFAFQSAPPPSALRLPHIATHLSS